MASGLLLRDSGVDSGLCAEGYRCKALLGTKPFWGNRKDMGA